MGELNVDFYKIGIKNLAQQLLLKLLSHWRMHYWNGSWNLKVHFTKIVFIFSLIAF